MKKKLNIFSESIMYLALLAQMLYVLVGNTVHEILGIVFFVSLVVHIFIKRWWFKATLSGKGRKGKAGRFANIVTILLILTSVTLMISSMGVSRVLFP